jgi:ribonuclease HII
MGYPSQTGMKILGMDEAGRGPCIGPLIIAGVLINDESETELKELGVKDSKLLTHKKRCMLYGELKEIAEATVVIKVEPKEIDEAVESDSLNLNWLEAHKQAEIINQLNPDKAIIDCPSPNIRAYESYLRNLLKHKDIELVVEHKADVNYVSCSAASIVAKCVREEEVKKIEKLVGRSIGSGYPSNPICQRFIRENWNKYPGIFRKSWATWQNHKKIEQHKKLGEF